MKMFVAVSYILLVNQLWDIVDGGSNLVQRGSSDRIYLAYIALTPDKLTERIG